MRYIMLCSLQAFVEQVLEMGAQHRVTLSSPLKEERGNAHEHLHAGRRENSFEEQDGISLKSKVEGIGLTLQLPIVEFDGNLP